MAADHSNTAEVMPPIARNRREWMDALRELNVTDEMLDKIKAEKDALKRRKALLDAIHEANPSMNGEAKIVASTLATNVEQIDAKQRFITGKDEIDTEADETKELSDEQLEKAETEAKTKPESQNVFVRGAKFLWKKTFVEHPGLTIGALALLGWYYLVPEGFTLGSIPAFLQRLATRVPTGKMKQLIEAMLKLGSRTTTLAPGISSAPATDIGAI